ncbi:MAG: hypothetical protein H7316_08105 [Tardiphaga sp.]|uniref:hypothetical protein n=1 Tax=Tardiphaga sp. TaxID=1926292 RepID=UPI0019A337C2|nr:hypothetical protein [Tardiphaga sp.]MBC7583698.1 hypothetical protein [Tardiphaga sp.]
MNEDLLRGIAADMNDAADAATRVGRAQPLVADTNSRIAAAAIAALPFDSSPYGFVAWLAAVDKT